MRCFHLNGLHAGRAPPVRSQGTERRRGPLSVSPFFFHLAKPLGSQQGLTDCILSSFPRRTKIQVSFLRMGIGNREEHPPPSRHKVTRPSRVTWCTSRLMMPGRLLGPGAGARGRRRQPQQMVAALLIRRLSGIQALGGPPAPRSRLNLTTESLLHLLLGCPGCRWTRIAVGLLHLTSQFCFARRRLMAHFTPSCLCMRQESKQFRYWQEGLDARAAGFPQATSLPGTLGLWILHRTRQQHPLQRAAASTHAGLSGRELGSWLCCCPRGPGAPSRSLDGAPGCPGPPGPLHFTAGHSEDWRAQMSRGSKAGLGERPQPSATLKPRGGQTHSRQQL